MKFARAVIASVMGACALVQFVFWGGEGIGVTLLFWTLVIAFYVACGLPKGDMRHKIENAALAALVAGLALCYTLFANSPLQVMNILALIFLTGLLFLHGTLGQRIKWDRPIFIVELAVGYFCRPFVCLPRPWKEAKAIRSERTAGDHRPVLSKNGVRVFVQILAACIVSIPLLLILATLLAASDPVFADMTSGFFDMLAKIQLNDIVLQSILFMILLPFTASAVWSYRDSYASCSENQEVDTAKRLYFPPAFAITILTLVNLLYLVFAKIQFEYLFGAWNGTLPDGITSAVYARNGFFELAFVAALNIILLLCSIRFTLREGHPGLIIRCLSIALLTLSSVQLVSALRRMYLYIMAYGFSQLRYFVSAFMFLMAIFFLFFLIREFVTQFPLFRSMILAGAVSLLLLNLTVPDARIAQYNIDRYLDHSLDTLDVKYIEQYLSADAHVILLRNEDDIIRQDADMKDILEASKGNIEQEAKWYEENKLDNWKYFNVSEEARLLEIS
jgi:hypothetical protein